jgi:hypothetical protein
MSDPVELYVTESQTVQVSVPEPQSDLFASYDPAPTELTVLDAPGAQIVIQGGGGGGGGAETLSELNDVDVTSTPPSNNQPLVYNSLANKWIPGNEPVKLEYIFGTTEILPPGGAEDLSLNSPLVFNILGVYSATPAWIRVYGTSSARTADTRTSPGGVPPAAGTDFYAEVVTTQSPQIIRLSPVPMMLTDSEQIFIRIVNMDTVSRDLPFSLGILAYGVSL